MKNITVSVDDETYRMARVHAAQRDTSVSRLVRDFLQSLAAGESDFERRKQLQDSVLASVRRFRGADRLDRAALHNRK